MTGTGLHGILWFADPVEFTTDGDRERWTGIVQVVQAALPIDPDQPGITATTRALGSTNSKNGAKVIRLAKGDKVGQEEVLSLYGTMCSSPFITTMQILTGDSRVSPCPIWARFSVTSGGEASPIISLPHLCRRPTTTV